MKTDQWAKNVKSRWTNVVMTSEKSHMPRMDAATPLTAEETMCVMGEVTFMDNKLAMLIKKPNRP